jgi:hypothetical protein
MQTIRKYVSAIVLVLFSTVVRICQSNPLFKRFARALLRLFPTLARFYARRIARPALPQRQRILTAQASVIFSDLKSAISQAESNIDTAPVPKGR